MIENQSNRPSGSFDRVVNHVRQSLKCLEVQVGRYRSRPGPCEHARLLARLFACRGRSSGKYLFSSAGTDWSVSSDTTATVWRRDSG